MAKISANLDKFIKYFYKIHMTKIDPNTPKRFESVRNAHMTETNRRLCGDGC